VLGGRRWDRESATAAHLELKGRSFFEKEAVDVESRRLSPGTTAGRQSMSATSAENGVSEDRSQGEEREGSRKPGSKDAGRAGAIPKNDGRPVERPDKDGEEPKAEDWRGEPDDRAGPGQ